MQQTDVVRRFLFPPHEDAAVAIQPRVDALDDPPSRTVSAAALRPLFTPRANVRRVASAAGRAANGIGVVAFVAAEMLFAPPTWPRSRDGDAVKSGISESLIMHVGASHRQTDRHAAPVGEHRPLHAALTAIGRVSSGFFPHPAVPSSSLRPDSAIARRFHADHRSVSTAISTVDRRRPEPSTLGSTDGPCCRSRSTSGRPSIGNQCAARNRCRSSPAVGSLAAVRHVAIGGNGARDAECVARMRPTATNYIREIRPSRESPPCYAKIPSTDLSTCVTVHWF